MSFTTTELQAIKAAINADATAAAFITAATAQKAMA